MTAPSTTVPWCNFEATMVGTVRTIPLMRSTKGCMRRSLAGASIPPKLIGLEVRLGFLHEAPQIGVYNELHPPP
jgi:hypothetical protein